MFDPDLWLRQQLWEQLWKGPGAVSTYWSIAIQLVCVALSALGSTELQGPNLWILSIIILLGVLLILNDEIASCRNHRLGLLRFSAANSRAVASPMPLAAPVIAAAAPRIAVIDVGSMRVKMCAGES